MKKFPIAAAALLFGTSAFAMTPSTAPTGVWLDKDPYMVAGTTAVNNLGHEAMVQQASATSFADSEPVAWSPAKSGFKAASMSADDAKAATIYQASDADGGIAEVEEDADAEALDAEPAAEAAVAVLEPAAYETTALDEQPVPVENGVGGPDAHVDIAAADLTTRPATQNYPACRPGAGDDNCIQLYEPGVRQRLAAWTQPTGGFAGDAEVRMAAADEAMTTDTIQTALAEDASYEQPVDDEDVIEV